MSAAVHTDPLSDYLFSPPTGSRRFIKTSGESNEFMKTHIINLTERRLRQVCKRLAGTRITIQNLAYRKNIKTTPRSRQRSRSSRIVSILAPRYKSMVCLFHR